MQLSVQNTLVHAGPMTKRRQQSLVSFFGASHSDSRKHTLNPYDIESDRESYSKCRRNHVSRFGTCPICQACLPLHALIPHAETCDGRTVSPAPVSVQTPKEDIDSSEVPLGNSDGNRSGCPTPHAQKAAPLSDFNASCTVACSQPISSDIKGLINDKETSWWKKKLPKDETRYSPSPTSEPLPGLYLFEDFITKEEEKIIIAELDGMSQEYRGEFLPWKHSYFNGKHQGKRWGVHCNLRDRRVEAPEHPLPHFIQDMLLSKLKTLRPMMGCVPNEANAIDYRRRAGDFLKSHVDDRQLSKEPIANLSIAGDCIMTFGNEKLLRSRGVKKSTEVMLKRRTLQVLTGKARYDYSHGIVNQDLLSDRRVSVTMRESPLTKGFHHS